MPDPTLADLTAAIDRLLGLSVARAALQLNRNATERAYEAYVFSLCAAAVRSIPGGRATLVGVVSGPNPATVVFRGAPGSMASRTQDFAYLDCQLGARQFEIHVDVEYEGQSRATHEIDVSGCSAEHARQVRRTGQAPRTNKHLLMAFECKLYTSDPGVALARTFVGLVADCSTNLLNGFVCNRRHRGLSRYLSRSGAPEPFTELSPLDPDSETEFLNVVKHRLKRWSPDR
jgi:hypothetical protein